MARATPIVQTDILHYQQNQQSQYLKLDTPEWFEWLTRANIFAFACEQGSFTARKEPASNQRGDTYWRAYRRKEGKLYRVYLGKNAELSLSRLLDTAKQIADQSLTATTSQEKETREKVEAVAPLAPLEPEVKTLLTTKLLMPGSSDYLVARPRLTQILEQGRARARLSLVSAPAGFGKTTIVIEWLQSLQGPKIAWVSLDEADNDPIRFWSYFWQALALEQSSEGHNFLKLLRSPQPPSIEQILTGLINQIVAQDEAIVLVLDDYHLINSASVSIHQGIAFLLEHLPPRLHLVITSRADPPLPLARMRVRRQLTELKATDLRFSLEETTSLRRSTSGLSLSAQDIARLESKTEGWAAALQLAALLMQGRPDIESFIKTFGGDQRFMLDYLAEEVLQRQPEPLQHFLLQTAMLDRFNASLVEEVTGCQDGQAMLDQLMTANLFLIPLDGENGWYRYHHLFRQYLLNRLEQSQAEHLPFLHRWAAHWYEEHQLPLEAIEHALAGQDFNYAAELIDQNTQEMYQRSELRTLLRWLDALPREIIYQHLHTSLNYAWVQVLMERNQAAIPYIEVAAELVEKARAENSIALPVINALEGEIAATRAFIARKEANFSQSIALSQQALHLIAPEQGFLRCAITINQAHCYAALDDQNAAIREYSQTEKLGRACGSDYFRLMAITSLARLYWQQGQLQLALANCQRALKLTELQLLPIMSTAYFVQASVWREWNDLEAAAQSLNLGLQLLETSGDLNQVVGYIELGRVRQAQGDLSTAHALLEKAEQLIYKFDQPEILGQVEQFAVRQWLATGELGRVEAWAKQNQPAPSTFWRETDQLLLARLHLAQNRPAQALELVIRLAETSRTTGRIGLLVESLVLQALALQGQNQPDPARQVLGQALRQAEPEGFVRLFLDEGGPMLTLLTALSTQAQSFGMAYLTRLLAAGTGSSQVLAREIPPAVTPLASNSTPVVMVEALTEREKEVLRLLATTTLNSAQIADHLVVAVSTVRTHIKNIYLKLEVQNRLEAIARSRELGLLK